ncbi:serine--tRNA ligase [Symbiobacterium thermophilum]|uniref:Serine--tRNA ligase n=3 Tax=Symbiobacterium thermophilum TaxID=2734 RepID=SYS_SYMTH|nr:serine--tRNA ligase [Symbiobacterium thermophilum]Q67TJ8.1 RecName: Full=Serine--tRNA ligase; AltName: Full=Seryl-tRNA synthetase; Short=SerRS; AltName: Full=Seryl-tRNA(Ser/Sec) synthetase [Symbiobacterium thermophilum IAM 14863]MBY6275805.1 serine--tRNA ligase [Symbiobacterium thermophilum]BAD38995.1 seryl-tRNA synthetase [Symbiobacterium thermophilum IAM 14863]
MLDLRFVRTNPDVVRQALINKGVSVDLDRILALDVERRQILAEVEQLKARRNQVSKQVGILKQQGQDVSAIIAEMGAIGDRIKELDDRERQVSDELQDLLYQLPNLPAPDVPVGPDETGNVEVKRWGEPRQFAFPVKPHWDLGVAMDGLDFERAAKVTGSRFSFIKGGLARLHRALVSFFIDYLTERGYREVLPPVIINTASYYGSGQFPKFKEDVFSLAGTDYHLASTAEVPLVNMHRDEILDEAVLPLRYVGYSGCFRSEAGAAGRDTRGLIRQHYFEKVEMVQFTRPEESEQALMEIVANAEGMLEQLNLPYRRMLMCTGDMGFGQYKKYDIEVWMPSYERYVEISSCSNMSDFQARRANIRYRPAGGKPEFVHTLNGSGLAVGRTLAAVMENYQNEDGSITVPEVLRPYTRCERIER